MNPTISSEAFAALVKLSELRPGDIILMSPKPSPKQLGLLPSLATKAFVSVSKDLQGDKTHSAIYTGDGHVVEARMESGITRKPLTEALKDVTATVVRPKVPIAERRAAALRAMAMHKGGLKYDMPGLFRAVAQEIGIPTSQKKKLDAVTCSTLISNSYKTDLVGKHKDAVMPADFLRSKMTKVVRHFGGPDAKTP